LHGVAARVLYCSISSHPSWSPEISGGHYRVLVRPSGSVRFGATNDGGMRAGQVVSAAT
jgi:hypothetical protein